MFEKYNHKIIKILKLITIMTATYFISLHNTGYNDKENAIKSSLLIGLIFMILDGYYPRVDIEQT